MRTNTSFQSILEQKIHQRMESSSPRSSQTAIDQDPAHLAFLLGVLHKSAYQGPLTKHYPSRPKPPPAPHALSPEQQLAFDFFVSFEDLGLSPAFTQKELRNAFRRLALRLHPDMNKGASGPFIELKTHYTVLLQLFS